MKKFLLIVLAAGLLFSCQKKDETPQFQDVSFTALEITPSSGLKSTEDWICKTDVPTHAWVVINGTSYYPQLFNLDGKLYTQSIKLAVGTYCVTDFVLYKEVSGEGFDPLVDIAVYGTPHVGSPYAVYVDKALGLDDNQQCVFGFTVVEFTKAQLDIQVLCYLDADYDAFGFDWFAITEIVIREQCFFGDFCIKHPELYRGSNYFEQSTWPDPVPPFIDAPAIVEIHVAKYNAQDDTWTPVAYSPFTNNTLLADYGVGAPVCIQYPDNLSIPGELFRAVLKILVKQGNGFVFQEFYTWTFTDAQMIVPAPPASDGVVDFVLGSCNLDGADLVLAPWQDLPSTANVTIVYPATLPNAYWDITFNSFDPAGTYDIPEDLMMAGWCGDKNHFITPGTFTGYVYPSLDDTNWPDGMPFDINEIAQVNWLMNHLADFGYSLGNDNGAEGGPLQQAIWEILNGIPATANPGPAMAAAASTHGDFIPLPGGWAAVLVVKQNLPLEFQLVFVVVDP